MNLLATIYILHINKCALFTFSLVHEELHNYGVIYFQLAIVVIRQNLVDPYNKEMRESEKERERRGGERRERGISENRILNTRTIKLIYALLSQVYCIHSLENALINFAIQSPFYSRNSVVAAFKSHQSFETSTTKTILSL